jgi:hypothetical protein
MDSTDWAISHLEPVIFPQIIFQNKKICISNIIPYVRISNNYLNKIIPIRHSEEIWPESNPSSRQLFEPPKTNNLLMKPTLVL